MSPIGFGAFKIGRNTGIKYPHGYELPDEPAVKRLLDAVLDLGINYIDTAPAYGLSEERLGRCLARRRPELVLSTKVGETFADGRSSYDFSAGGVRASVEGSLRRLRTDVIDILLAHSTGDDSVVKDDTVETLRDLRASGLCRAIGLSGKTVAGARAALAWADVIMVEYHLDDQTHAGVMEEAAEIGVGVVVKKGLAAGHLDPQTAIHFVLGNPAVSSLVVGGLDIDHLRDNMRYAAAATAGTSPPAT